MPDRRAPADGIPSWGVSASSEEQDPDLQARLAEEERAEAALAGREQRWVIRRRFFELVAPFWALALAGILAGLDAPLAAGGLVVATSALLVLRARTRVGRLRFGGDGSFGLVGRLDPLDFGQLARLSFRYRFPRIGRELDRQALATAEVTFELKSGERITLPRGAIWRIAPDRRPILPYVLRRELLTRAKAAGMHVEHLPGDAFVATAPDRRG